MKPRTIDRTFRGVGRIKKSAGTVTPAVFRRINERLDELASVGDTATLQRVKDGLLALVELLDLPTPAVQLTPADLRDRRKPSHIYAVLRPDTREVKIGIAVDVRRRLDVLQVSNATELVLLANIPGDRDAEREAHRALAAFHIRGEWFRATPEVLAWIDNQTAGHTKGHTMTLHKGKSA